MLTTYNAARENTKVKHQRSHSYSNKGIVIPSFRDFFFWTTFHFLPSKRGKIQVFDSANQKKKQYSLLNSFIGALITLFKKFQQSFYEQFKVNLRNLLDMCLFFCDRKVIFLILSFSEQKQLLLLTSWSNIYF